MNGLSLLALVVLVVIAAAVVWGQVEGRRRSRDRDSHVSEDTLRRLREGRY